MRSKSSCPRDIASRIRDRAPNRAAIRIADEAQEIVFDAARPIFPGEGVKAQQRRAWAALGRPPFWRVRAAWHGAAGTWSAVAMDDLRERHRARRERNRDVVIRLPSESAIVSRPTKGTDAAGLRKDGTLRE